MGKKSEESVKVEPIKQPTIKIPFLWLNVEIGREPYKPAKAVLNPVDQKVLVEMPLALPYIANAVEIIQAQLAGNQPQEAPILTEQGVSVVCRKLEEAMTYNPATPKPDEEDAGSDDDWGEAVWDEKDSADEPKTSSNMTNEELHAKPDEEELNWDEEE